MSEEEKKAIELLTKFYNKYKNIIDIVQNNNVQNNNVQNDVKQTSDEFTNETRYYTPEGEIYKTIIETYKCPKNYISKNKITDKIKEIKYYEKIQPSDNVYTYKELIQYGEEILQEMLEEN